MNNLFILVAATMLVAADDAKKDLAKLQGTWSYASFVDPNHDKMPAEQLKKMSITFAGDKWTIKEDDRVVVWGTQKLDPSRTPHEIDSLIMDGEGKGTTMLGIYEFHGDTFRVCFDPTGKERPTSFTPKIGQFAGVIERQKKNPNPPAR